MLRQHVLHCISGDEELNGKSSDHGRITDFLRIQMIGKPTSNSWRIVYLHINSYSFNKMRQQDVVDQIKKISIILNVPDPEFLLKRNLLTVATKSFKQLNYEENRLLNFRPKTNSMRTSHNGVFIHFVTP